MKHVQRIIGHVSGWQEHLDQCVCGDPWPCVRGDTVSEIVQHIPNFVSGVEPQREHFTTRDGLFMVPFVNQWAETPGFHRFSRSHVQNYPSFLMAEFDEGKRWFVVGFLHEKGIRPIDLPVWRGEV